MLFVINDQTTLNIQYKMIKNISKKNSKDCEFLFKTNLNVNNHLRQVKTILSFPKLAF